MNQVNHALENKIRQLNELKVALDEFDIKRNRITIGDFQKFVSLFNKEQSSKMSKDEINKLSAEFSRKFDLYNPIFVVDHNDIVLFEIPQMFMPIESVDINHVNAVDKFRSDINSDIPKYVSEGVDTLLLALLKSQRSVRRDDKSYDDYIKEVSLRYKQTVEDFNNKKNGINPAIVIENKNIDIVNDSNFSWK